MTTVTEPPPDKRVAPARDRRVAEVQRQARWSLAIAAVFVAAALVAAAWPHHTGTWLPLHLFLVGGVLSAISGASQLLAVTWSAAPAPPAHLAALQRGCLAGGAVGLALTREIDAPAAFVGASGALVMAALVLLGVLLLGIRAGAVIDRFHATIDGYLVALTFGVLGGGAGVLMASGTVGSDVYGRVRAAHLTINLLGLVGVVIAATLPSFTATQARTRLSPRATPRAVRASVGVLAASVLVAAIGYLARWDALVAASLGLYAIAVLTLARILPPLRRKQFEWAGPRLLQLLAGIGWWAVGAGLLAVSAVADRPATGTAWLTLVIGGYAQVLAASLAYLAPVLRGGGHVRLTAGFAATRSWLALVAGNTAAIAALAGHDVLLAAALGVWGTDTALRAVRLFRTHS